MRNIAKRTMGTESNDQKGFTLFELLITVGIIVALAGSIIPLVIQFANKGDEGSQATELNTVQSAINHMMTINTVTTITARPESGSAVIIPGETFDISGGDIFSNYLRLDGLPTECSYYWNNLGLVTLNISIAPCIP